MCVCVYQDLDSDGPEPSDWDKYASEEYEILVAEETANEQLREGWVNALCNGMNSLQSSLHCIEMRYQLYVVELHIAEEYEA